jgi:CheY-like chemotaxis protein
MKRNKRMRNGEREDALSSLAPRGIHGTVLVVDDDRALVGRVGWLLVAAGYRVLVARSLEALGVAHEVQPGAIVLGPTLVGRDAAGLVGLLRALPMTAVIPLVVLATPEGWAGGARLAVDAVAPLPGDAGPLCATLARWLWGGHGDAVA